MTTSRLQRKCVRPGRRSIIAVVGEIQVAMADKMSVAALGGQNIRAAFLAR
jgi:hypothetical protein